MTERFRNPVIKYTTDTLKTLPNSKLYFYQNGTSTPKAVYADKNKNTSLGAVVTSDPAGVFVPIFLDGTYRVELKNSAGATQTGWPVDNVGGEDTVGAFDDWSPITSYSIGNLVTASNGLRFTSLQNSNLNNDPLTSPTYWQELRLTLAWNSLSTFASGDRVFYSGLQYISLQSSNTGNIPASSSAWWKQVDEESVWNASTTYAINDVAHLSGVRYRSLQNTNLNNNPSGSQNYWKAEKVHYTWNAGTTYTAGTYVYDGELRYSAVQSANTNHQPSTDTSFTWWKPESRLYIEAVPQLIKVKSVSGGGALSAEWLNVITDASTYTLPLANSVPANTWIGIKKSDVARNLVPGFDCSGADTITYLGGTATGIDMDGLWADTIDLYSNGSNTWSC
jgi:hypothetical protein